MRLDGEARPRLRVEVPGDSGLGTDGWIPYGFDMPGGPRAPGDIGVARDEWEKLGKKDGYVGFSLLVGDDTKSSACAPSVPAT